MQRKCISCKENASPAMRTHLLHEHQVYTASLCQVDPQEDAPFVRVAGCLCDADHLPAAKGQRRPSEGNGAEPGAEPQMSPAAAAVAEGRVREVRWLQWKALIEYLKLMSLVVVVVQSLSPSCHQLLPWQRSVCARSRDLRGRLSEILFDGID